MKPKLLPERIDIRLSTQAKADLERDAASRRMPLADLIRERLDVAQSMSDQIATLREDVAFRLGQDNRPPTSPTAPEITEALHWEMLLLLRMIAGPQRQSYVDGELKWLGLKPWAVGPQR